jgi:hypothetical protein
VNRDPIDGGFYGYEWPMLWPVPIGEMAEGDPVADEFEGTLSLLASVAGEMAAGDVPLGIGQNEYNVLLEKNEGEPREVVVEIAPGKSKRGWTYREAVFDRIVGEVNNGGLPGYKGHQKPEDVAHQFVDPVTHWVGALKRDGKYYFRGVIDKHAPAIKDWLRSKRVSQVSIFGFPKVARVAGEIQVVDYEPISIDWTPLKRAGMPTRIVAFGEMDAILKEGEKPDPPKEKEPKEGGRMDLSEWLAKGRELNVTPEQAIGELKWGPDDVTKAIKVEVRSEEDEAISKAFGEMAEKLGLDEKERTPEKVAARLDELKKLEDDKNTDEHDKIVDKVIGEMVALEKGRPVVKRMLKVADSASEADVKKAVGELLEADDVKSSLKALGMQIPIDPHNGGGNRDDKGSLPSGFRRRRVSI